MSTTSNKQENIKPNSYVLKNDLDCVHKHEKTPVTCYLHDNEILHKRKILNDVKHFKFEDEIVVDEPDGEFYAYVFTNDKK